MGKSTGGRVDVAIRKLRVNKTRLAKNAFTVIFKNENYVGSNNISCKSQFIPFNWTSLSELKPSPSMWTQSYGK